MMLRMMRTMTTSNNNNNNKEPRKQLKAKPSLKANTVVEV
jgi:hypothetical protein